MTASKEWRRACFIAATAEIRAAERTLPTKAEKLEMHAAGLRAKRILDGCSGKKLPASLEAKIRKHLPA